MKHYGDLYEQQMNWFEIIDALEKKKKKERIERYREELQKVEKSILPLTGDATIFFRRCSKSIAPKQR